MENFGIQIQSFIQYSKHFVAAMSDVTFIDGIVEKRLLFGLSFFFFYLSKHRMNFLFGHIYV